MSPKMCDAAAQDDTIRQDASKAAIAAVFGTYELLEQVLSSLSLHDLFVLQRVAQNWQDVIKRSALLQKKMFLLADGTAQSPLKDHHNFISYDGAKKFNPAVTVETLKPNIHGISLHASKPLGRWAAFQTSARTQRWPLRTTFASGLIIQ